MMHDLVVELLPARHGDAILLEWPDPSSVDRPIRRMLVDCGPAYAYAGIADRLRRLGSPHIDRLVLTHVDADHIEGMILAVNDKDLALEIDEVWYNGSPHLVDKLGAAQGEILGALIAERKLGWNQTFQGKAAGSPSDRWRTRRESSAFRNYRSMPTSQRYASEHCGLKFDGRVRYWPPSWLDGGPTA